VQFDKAKFKALVHYAIWRAGAKDGFGATKLYKALWFSEAKSFVLRGKPLAGAVYVREEHGPVPRLGKVVRDELEAEGKIKQSQESGKYKQWHFKALAPPDVAFLSVEEKKDLDYWIDTLADKHTAKSASDLSHEDDGCWQMARMGEEIPFHAFMTTRIREMNNEEQVWAKRRAKELGLN